MNNNSMVRNYIDIKSEVIHNATKKKIIDTAIDFFSRKGYTGVSIRDITREVGIKESSLYKHFQNKEEILETIFLNFRMDVSKIVPPVDQLDLILSMMSPKAFLERGLLNFKEHAEDPLMQKVWRILYIEQFRDTLARDIYKLDVLQKTIDFLEQAFEKMTAKKLIKSINSKMLAVEYQYPIFTMISEYIMLKSDQADTSEVEQKMVDHLEFFYNVIKPDNDLS